MTPKKKLIEVAPPLEASTTRCGAAAPCAPFFSTRIGVGSRTRYAETVNDTSPAADARYHHLLRAMLPERRLEAAMGLSQGVREMALAGLRLRHPQADEQELRVRLTVRLYGRAAAVRLFGAVPDDAV